MPTDWTPPTATEIDAWRRTAPPGGVEHLEAILARHGHAGAALKQL